MKRIVIFLLLVSTVLSTGSRLQAQCTASPEDAAAAQAAIHDAATGTWPLEVPRGIQVTSYDDLRGALLVAGSAVYQIDSIVWRIAENGALDIQEFVGHTQDGIAVRTSRRGGATVDPASVGGFILGNPKGHGRKIQVESLRFATDRDGFLTVAEMKGFDLGTGEEVTVADGSDQDPTPGPECGLRVATGCSASNCNGGACGAWPGCPCNGTSGSCSGYSSTICSGTCPEGMVCNGSVTDCRCIPKPKPPAPAPAGGGADRTP